MDKFFLVLGVHNFRRFAVLKFAFIFGLVLLAAVATRFVYRADISYQALAIMFIGLAWSMSIFGVSVAFSQLMRKTLEVSTLTYFDNQLLHALHRESKSRYTPITWNMVAAQVAILRSLNKDLAKKEKDALALKQQQRWLAEKGV